MENLEQATISELAMMWLAFSETPEMSADLDCKAIRAQISAELERRLEERKARKRMIDAVTSRCEVQP